MMTSFRVKQRKSATSYTAVRSVPAHTSPHRVRRSESGQALVEFSLFFVLLMLIISLMVNLGGLLNDHVSLEYAARQGARTASVLNNQTSADCGAIGAIDAATQNLPSIQLTQIIIYKAGANGQPTGAANSENDYNGSVRCTVTGGVASTTQTCTNAVGGACPWLPANRNNAPYTADSIGVKIVYSYTYQFPLLGGGSFNASDYTVMPIAPVGIPSPAPTPTPVH